MTAATVPPPSWIPIGAPEIRANTRRFFTRALAISAAIHLVILASYLGLRAREPSDEPKWLLSPIDLIPTPLIPPSLPAAPRDPPRTAETPPDDGDLVLKPDIRVVIPTAKAPVTEGEEKRNPARGAAPPSTTTGDSAIDRALAEDAFVAFDQAPVPYFRPAPDYPLWARDQGIEGRVVLHALVGRDGRVTRITVLRDVVGLTNAAREAIARWRFHPALSGRNPVAVWVEIPIEFRL